MKVCKLFYVFLSLYCENKNENQSTGQALLLYR